jgi:hypothetical protein
MTCHIGDGIIICTGLGAWHVAQLACPWCCLGDAMVRCLTTPIHSGYCGFDSICGSCGQRWSSDEPLRKMSEEQREENIAWVASVPDPKCWKCHDTGDPDWLNLEIEEESKPCECGATEAQRG